MTSFVAHVVESPRCAGGVALVEPSKPSKPKGQRPPSYGW